MRRPRGHGQALATNEDDRRRAEFRFRKRSAAALALFHLGFQGRRSAALEAY